MINFEIYFLRSGFPGRHGRWAIVHCAIWWCTALPANRWAVDGTRPALWINRIFGVEVIPNLIVACLSLFAIHYYLGFFSIAFSNFNHAGLVVETLFGFAFLSAFCDIDSVTTKAFQNLNGKIEFQLKKIFVKYIIYKKIYNI